MKTYKWTEQQKKALRGSIRKWVKIYKGTGHDEGTDNCPCCKIWHNLSDDKKCVGCPISEFTGHDECSNTPYSYWQDNILIDKDGSRFANHEREREIARSELNFLRAVYLAGGGQ